MTKRRIFYVTGTRADFGLMRRTLQGIQAHPALELGVCVTGMHLSPLFGNTVNEIKSQGFPIVAEIPVAMESGEALEMTLGLATELAGFAKVFAAEKPDAVLLLGDRGEMLMAALAAIHFNIPVAHIHGGERSGSVDEPVRHAISKLAHYHFTATENSRQRLMKMGEDENNIFVTGAPGLDDIMAYNTPSRADTLSAYGFNPDLPTALCVFHPVVQTADDAGRQMQEVLQALEASGVQALVLEPNADAGHQHIRRVIDGMANHAKIKVVKHLPRDSYLAWLAHVDVLVGNSSSGIIEAASFGTPVVNIGNRQQGRERNKNTADVAPVAADVLDAIQVALAHGRYPQQNVYGNGTCYKYMPQLLASLPLSDTVFDKLNSY